MRLADSCNGLQKDWAALRAHLHGKAKSRPGAKAKPKAKSKAKLPPHLKKRFVWAFLKLVDYLAWCPTRAFFHCVAEAIFRRVEYVWGEHEFLQYFVPQYMIRVRASDSSIDGTEHFWGARWWVGIGRYSRLPPSQQPSESLNAIIKRQLRAQGPVTTHVDLVQKFAKALQTLSTPMLFGADRSKKPVTLMGRDVRSGKPDTPSDWMWQKGKSVRRPFDKFLSVVANFKLPTVGPKVKRFKSAQSFSLCITQES